MKFREFLNEASGLKIKGWVGFKNKRNDPVGGMVVDIEEDSCTVFVDTGIEYDERSVEQVESDILNAYKQFTKTSQTPKDYDICKLNIKNMKISYKGGTYQAKQFKSFGELSIWIDSFYDED